MIGDLSVKSREKWEFLTVVSLAFEVRNFAKK